MNERQIEMLWRCSSCGHQNLGRHGTCQGCANPKDGSEEWVMPADTAAAPTVTDPALLAIAKGGADWRCPHCDASHRNADGSCRNCGAGKPSAPVSARPPTVIRTTGCTWGCGAILTLLAGVVVGGALLIGGGAWFFLRPPQAPSNASVFGLSAETSVEATVASAHWEHEVDIEREQLVDREGFRDDVPKGAQGVKAAGTRLHHHDTVQDGWTTEMYEVEVPDGTRTRTVSEQVADGFDTRHRTDRVRCGEECSPGPETCRERCQPNGNGFATCRTECTPGRERCTTKWCDERRTEQSPRTRTVTRTISEPATRTEARSRRVPAFTQVPRYAPYFTWKGLEYVFDRTERARGEGFETRWPEAPRRGVTERPAARRAHYRIVFRALSGPATWSWSPTTHDDFLSFARSGRYRLLLRDGVVLGVEER
ncbi:MAG: hypothetical protein JNJ54_22525 [Myxococcaceae bacterium]|nr:hypothetical protein [Myxococcaceae bacterium]